MTSKKQILSIAASLAFAVTAPPPAKAQSMPLQSVIQSSMDMMYSSSGGGGSGAPVRSVYCTESQDNKSCERALIDILSPTYLYKYRSEGDEPGYRLQQHPVAAALKLTITDLFQQEAAKNKLTLKSLSLDCADGSLISETRPDSMFTTTFWTWNPQMQKRSSTDFSQDVSRGAETLCRLTGFPIPKPRP